MYYSRIMPVKSSDYLHKAGFNHSNGINTLNISANIDNIDICRYCLYWRWVSKSMVLNSP